MNPFLHPPDRSTRQVIDANVSVSDPPSDPAPSGAGQLVPASSAPWPAPVVAPVAPTAQRDRWPTTPLQQYTAALLVLLALGGVAVLAGVPSADAGDVLSGFGAYVTTLVLGVAGAAISIVASGRTSSTPRSVNDAGTDEMLFRVVFGAMVALILVVMLQSDTQNVVNANGQTAHLWAVIGGFGERLARRFVAGQGGTPVER